MGFRSILEATAVWVGAPPYTPPPPPPVVPAGPGLLPTRRVRRRQPWQVPPGPRVEAAGQSVLVGQAELFGLVSIRLPAQGDSLALPAESMGEATVRLWLGAWGIPASVGLDALLVQGLSVAVPGTSEGTAWLPGFGPEEAEDLWLLGVLGLTDLEE